MTPDLTRRQFTAAAAAMSGLAAAATTVAQEAPPKSAAAPLIRPGDTILFQGDSITDAGRARDLAGANSPAALGKGYAWLAAAQLLLDRPGDNLKFFNRGVSGNKVFQLADRWQADCLDLKPNVLSILIGVNDIWHKLNGQYDGTVEKFQTDYAALLKRSRDALPEVRLVICEPFVLRVGAVTEKWFPEFDAYRAAARSVAKEGGAAFVPFYEMFEAAVKLAPPERWAKDGVHPDPDGAALMAHAWLKAVGAS
jgi:lysophospholipase L1-like esterase